MTRRKIVLYCTIFYVPGIVVLMAVLMVMGLTDEVFEIAKNIMSIQ